MKTAIYPGSFNPWHQGHRDIMHKAEQIFDHIVIAQGFNPEKYEEGQVKEELRKITGIYSCKITHIVFTGFLTELIKSLNRQGDYTIDAVIRGLRNGNDLQYEQNQQYWYEDLGLQIPIAYFITHRDLGHISSSAIRAIDKISKGKSWIV